MTTIKLIRNVDPSYNYTAFATGLGYTVQDIGYSDDGITVMIDVSETLSSGDKTAFDTAWASEFKKNAYV